MNVLQIEKNCKMRLLNGLLVAVIFFGYLVATPTIANNPTISTLGLKLIVSYGAYVKMGNDERKVSQLLNQYFSQVNQTFGNTNLNQADSMNIFTTTSTTTSTTTIANNPTISSHNIGTNLIVSYGAYVKMGNDTVIHDHPNTANNNLNKYNEDRVTWKYESIISSLQDSLSDSDYPMVILFTNNDIRDKEGNQVFGFSGIGQFISKYNFAVISLFAFDPHQMAVSLVVAHEVGHLLGVKHDQSHENRSDCNPPTIADAYIMNETQNFRYGPNYMKSSSCSVEDIIDNDNICQDCEDSCGNGIVDQDEECDDSGPCCNAVSCRLKPGAQCSPWHSTCCDSNCQVLPKDHICLPADLTNCYDESRCDGTSPQCLYYQNRFPDGDSCYDSKLEENNRIQWRNSFNFYFIFLLIIYSAIIFVILFFKSRKRLLLKRALGVASVTAWKWNILLAPPTSYFSPSSKYSNFPAYNTVQQD